MFKKAQKRIERQQARELRKTERKEKQLEERKQKKKGEEKPDTGFLSRLRRRLGLRKD